MERYCHLQTMINSPLTPLTPLSENTKFEFNFGGDGSLDMYINSVRQEHREEQQQKRLLQQANQTSSKKDCTVFEDEDQYRGKQYDCSQHKQHQPHFQNETSKAVILKITTPTPTKRNPALRSNYVATSTNVRTPLKPKNNNMSQNIDSRRYSEQQQQKLQQKHLMQKQDQTLIPNQSRIFHKASPVAAKPLCPQVANILQRSGFSNYCRIFEKEEIDLFTFHLLKFQDLQEIGITNKKHCLLLMREIHYAGQHI